MQQHIITSQQDQRSGNVSEQTSSTMSSQRRPSLWEKMKQGGFHSVQADREAVGNADPKSFAHFGARFDDGFGSSALWESTLKRPPQDSNKQRQRNSLGEDALRQMS
ncbi:hypothetical protein INT45_009049 [Circinella minor]|uniref:Uncharacterized protein n=1 Tax=Circinella minor TaxID=1195481 RepID=A0A8H7S8J8_9FUNG|nr:hypothetical protein INT45_009049 [Circinella minor]